MRAIEESRIRTGLAAYGLTAEEIDKFLLYMKNGGEPPIFIKEKK